jgi:hypothetical protein
MCREMITMPLRIVACTTRLGVRLTEEVVGVALSVTRRLIEAAVPGEPQRMAPGGGGETGGASVAIIIASPPSTPETTPDRPSADEVRSSAAPVPAPRAASPPMHVSEEVQFVEAFAEPGAEDGAGAEVHVKQPWNGYADMTAIEIIARLADATREQIAAVTLYERVHRRRRTVLAAAERQLRAATAASSGHVTAVDGSRRSGSSTCDE